MQTGVLFMALLLLFLLFFTLRDILLRTRSFAYQFVSVLLVAVFPIVGFLIYLLIRPARTLKEREVEAMLHQVMGMDEDETQLPSDPVIVIADDDAKKEPVPVVSPTDL